MMRQQQEQPTSKDNPGLRWTIAFAVTAAVILERTKLGIPYISLPFTLSWLTFDLMFVGIIGATVFFEIRLWRRRHR